MIVPMKKVFLFAVRDEGENALTALRELGVMEITRRGTVSAETRTLLDEWERLERPLLELRRNVPEKAVFKAVKDNGREILEEVLAKQNASKDIASELEVLLRRLKNLSPWGSFDKDLLDNLRKDVQIVLVAGTVREAEKLRRETKLAVEEIKREGSRSYFAVLADKGTELPENLPVFTLTKEDAPRVLAEKVAQLRRDEEAVKARIRELALELPSVEAYIKSLDEELEFHLNEDADCGDGGVSAWQGFVPEPELEKLRALSQKSGWGLYFTDPEEDDVVPVLVNRRNFFTRMIAPLFDFLGIVPGYRELDVSGGVMFFFTIYYAMIIGDAGYGLLFLALSLLMGLLGRRNLKLRPVIRLLAVLSVATIVWGALSGSYFGCQWGGLKCLTGETRDANVKVFCFLLAAVQLSIGHVWMGLSSRFWRKRLSNLGWMLVIIGNFFVSVNMIAYPGTFGSIALLCCFVPGLILLVLFGINWRDVGDIFQFPFSLIGSFTDVLSYIRLFAVGIAGSCIASTFNGMSMDVMKISPWLVIVTVLILFLGHGLNLALSLMSVMVHAVRLNTLEFSNHSGLTWSGNVFKPFKHKE